MRYLQETFGRGGHLSKVLPGYEPREGQVAMANEIHSAIAGRLSTLIEAPTGTGKSVGYLVPVTWWLIEKRDQIMGERPEEGPETDEQERPRAVVCTANIALQEQLIGKDVPLVQRTVPWSFKAALLKGKGNYLCLDRYGDTQAEYALLPPRDHFERERWKEIVAWSEVTQTGDFSELEWEIPVGMKPRLAVSADDCLGSACPQFQECWAQKARKEVKSSDVIVTNYHLLFTHLSLVMEGEPGILPPFDILVFDESHQASDIARDFFGFKLSMGVIKYALRLLVPGKGKRKRQEIDATLKEQVEDEAGFFFAELARVRRSRDYRARLVVPEAVSMWQRLRDQMKEVKNLYIATAATTEDAANAAELLRAARRCGIIAGWVESAMTLRDEDEWVYFIDENEKSGNVTLSAKPLKVDKVLREQLFESASIRSVICTSATLATSGGSLDYVACELGAEEARELVTQSPFNFSEQALFVVPDKLPDPKKPEFGPEVARLAVDVARLSRGRMLGLFTSYKALHLAAERLKNAVGDQYPVLVQGEGPRMKLVERFKREVGSILLGTKSFWAGVDVPGEALSCVLIDRIPFDPPDDPIVDALSELSRSSFGEYQLPRATIELKQGFGRLIRSTRDRGVVVCLDRRIIETGWGKGILKAMPRARFTRDLSEVGRFFGGG